MRVFERVCIACAAAAIALGTFNAARAGYNLAGYDLQVVQSATALANSAISYQTNALWSSSGVGQNVTTSFASSACESVGFARLYLDVWGGNSAYTCTVDASLNGTSLGEISIGGASDANPTFNAAQNCVYGSGSGMWQIAYGNIGSLLNTNGSANTLVYTITDTTEGDGTFDGRTYGASLVTVYSDPSIDQTLDYYLAEADGTLRRTSGSYGSPSERTLTISGIDTENVSNATYMAGYTHGTTGIATGADQLSFNGVSLGSSPNDVTVGDYSYLPSNLSFDVADILTENNTIQYSVLPAGDGSLGDSVLRANIAVLAVTHPVPEPGTFVLLLVGGAAAFFAARRRKLF